METIRSLDVLVPEFRDRVIAVRDRVIARGFDVRPVETMRTPWRQARIWRRSRSAGVVGVRIAQLRAQGLAYLADVLEGVGPQPDGPWGTNALPGFGFHSWGEAVDFGVFVGVISGGGGRYIFDNPDHPGYVAIAEESRAAGLTSGRYWVHADPPHVQFRPEDGPGDVYTFEQINAEMLARFGTHELEWFERNGLS